MAKPPSPPTPPALLPATKEVVETLAELSKPDSLPHTSSEPEFKASDIEHVNNIFDIAYAALSTARKTNEFCSIIRALQQTISMRRKILGYDTRPQSTKVARKPVDLLG